MKIVVLSADLMDRSKIASAYPDAVVVRSSAKLAEQAHDAELVLIDLNRLDEITAIAALALAAERVVAFGSHVDEALLEQAAEAGAEALPRSLFFRRIADGTL